MIRLERFVFESFVDGGVLMDVEGGAFFRLNTTAAFVWEQTLRGIPSGEVSHQLAQSFGVAQSVAHRDVVNALTLPEGLAFPPIPTDFLYEEVGDLYRFSSEGRTLFEVTRDGKRMRVLLPLEPPHLDAYLRAISAKLLALRAISVLHAGAVERPDGELTAFLGLGRAGKTTTAHAFALSGWRVVCEDKLVLHREGSLGIASRDGEPRIAKWARDMRNGLEAAVGTWLDASEIEVVAEGPAARLREIVLVDAERRQGNEISLRRLGPSEAAGEIFRHGFYGSTAPAEWRRRLSVAANIARNIPTYEATMPLGLDALTEAAGRYTEKTAS